MPNYEHITVCGGTQSGKSYGTFKMIKEMGVPAIYINSLNEEIKVFNKSEIKVIDFKKHTWEQLEYALKTYKLIDLRVSSTNAVKEVEYLIKKLEKRSNQQPLYVLFEEAYDYNGSLIVQNVFRRGRHNKIYGVLIGQTIADMSKKGVKQTFEKRIYRIAKEDEKYMIGNGYERKYLNLLEKASPYSYLLYKAGDVFLVDNKTGKKLLNEL